VWEKGGRKIKKKNESGRGVVFDKGKSEGGGSGEQGGRERGQGGEPEFLVRGGVGAAWSHQENGFKAWGKRGGGGRGEKKKGSRLFFLKVEAARWGGGGEGGKESLVSVGGQVREKGEMCLGGRRRATGNGGGGGGSLFGSEKKRSEGEIFLKGNGTGGPRPRANSGKCQVGGKTIQVQTEKLLR